MFSFSFKILFNNNSLTLLGKQFQIFTPECSMNFWVLLVLKSAIFKLEDAVVCVPTVRKFS